MKTLPWLNANSSLLSWSSMSSRTLCRMSLQAFMRMLTSTYYFSSRCVMRAYLILLCTWLRHHREETFHMNWRASWVFISWRYSTTSTAITHRMISSTFQPNELDSPSFRRWRRKIRRLRASCIQDIQGLVPPLSLRTDLEMCIEFIIECLLEKI